MADLFNSLFGFLPYLIGFVLVLVVLAAISFGIVRIFRFLGRQLLKPIRDPDILRIIRPAAFIFDWLIITSLGTITLKLAFGALGIDAINDPFDDVVRFLPKLVVALIVFTPITMLAALIWMYGMRQQRVWLRVSAAIAAIGIAYIAFMSSLDQFGIFSNIRR